MEYEFYEDISATFKIIDYHMYLDFYWPEITRWNFLFLKEV